MAFSFDVSTTVGKIRLLIPDSDAANHIFEDEEIDVFYSIEGSSIKRAAALGLETIARSEAMIQKVIRLLDLQTDGAALARELRLQAQELRKQADDEEFAEDAGFDIAEQVFDDFTYRERLRKQWLRTR